MQTHLQRVMGMDYMSVQEQLSVFYWMRFGAGAVFVLGALLFIYAVFVPRRELIEPRTPSADDLRTRDLAAE